MVSILNEPPPFGSRIRNSFLSIYRKILRYRKRRCSISSTRFATQLSHQTLLTSKRSTLARRFREERRSTWVSSTMRDTSITISSHQFQKASRARSCRTRWRTHATIFSSSRTTRTSDRPTQATRERPKAASTSNGERHQSTCVE